MIEFKEISEHVDDTIKSTLSPVIYGLNGSWWFYDEIGDEWGPYVTEQETYERLQRYCEEYLGEKVNDR